MTPPLPDGSRQGAWSRLWMAPVLALMLFTGGFALFAGLSRAQPERPLRPTDGIAVLTGGPQRVEAGLRLLQEGEGRWLIISGVGRDAALDQLMRHAGLDPQATEIETRITVGRQATSTRGNGAEVAEWVQARQIASLRVVTAAFHMPRALLELRRTLPGVELVPHPVQASGPRLGLLLREYGKLVGAMLGLSALKPEKPPS
ncbi:YdcF family protein [Roseomonas sp. USHLN139]|uniref:YdcF family protein n=1 Tax=Roseomonas sp. USHLN139 TaxID=3081298 RepID=UPI003B0201F0